MPGQSQLGFGAGFSTGLANALMAKRQERLQKEEKQSRMAQQFIELGMHSGQFTGIDDIPESLLNVAYPMEQGTGKGGKEKQALLRNTLHQAIQGVPGMPMMPGPAASQSSAQVPSGGEQGPLPGNLGGNPQPGGALDTGAPETSPNLASRQLAMPSAPPQSTRPLIHVGGAMFSVPSQAEVAQHKINESIGATEQTINAKIGLARRILPVLQQADPKANLDDALAAVGIKPPTTHQFTPVAIGRPLAAADVPADAVDEQGRPIDKTTAPFWQPVRGTSGSIHYQPGAQPTAAGGGASGLGSRNDYVRQWAVDNGLDPKNLSTADRDKAMKAYVHASSAAGETEEGKQKRGEDIADAIMSGEQPPELTRLAGLSGYVRDSLAKKGYDLTQATQDWMATQRYLATLNGPAQTRLRQSVEFVKESVPLVQSLSEDLDKVVDKTKYPLLNKGVMLAAKQGVLGPQARDAATNLDNQINELHTELAVMFRGGGSSTNEALQRADSLLQSNWDTKQLKTALDLIQKNAGIRLNSISSIGPSGTSAGNIYAPEGSTTPAPGAKTAAPTKNGAQPSGQGLQQDDQGNFYQNGVKIPSLK